MKVLHRDIFHLTDHERNLEDKCTHFDHFRWQRIVLQKDRAVGRRIHGPRWICTRFGMGFVRWHWLVVNLRGTRIGEFVIVSNIFVIANLIILIKYLATKTAWKIFADSSSSARAAFTTLIDLMDTKWIRWYQAWRIYLNDLIGHTSSQPPTLLAAPV